MQAPAGSLASVLTSALPTIVLVAKATALLGVATLTAFALRRASAAARHFAWTLGVVSVLALPLASALMPAWRIVVPIAVEEASTASDW